MKKLNIIILSILTIGISLTGVMFFIRHHHSVNETPKEIIKDTVYIENAVALYSEAIEGLDERDLQLTISENRSISEFGFTYQAQRNFTVRFDRSDPKDQRYHLKDEIIMGSHSIPWEEYRIGNHRYFMFSGLAFQEKTQPESNQKPYRITHPSATLDHTLYDKITASATENGYLIQFSEAAKLETWLSARQVHIEYISATARLSADKQLLSYTYSTAYQEGTHRIEVVYTVSVEPMDIAITLQEPEGGWLPLTHAQSPMVLEVAAGILVQATNVSSEYHEEIYFEALGDRRIRDIHLKLDNQNALSAQLITETTITKDSYPDQKEFTIKEENFTGGKYAVSQNGNNEIFDPSIDTDAMLRYLQNQLISTIMLPEYIVDCEIEAIGSNIRYIFTGNAAFAEFLCRNAGQQLYGDSELLYSETVTIKTDQLTCYLELNNNTGLPAASGISFSGSWEMQSLPYQFSYKVTQTYQYDVP